MPAPSTLGPLFGNDKLRAIYEKVAALEDLVGTDAFELDIPDFKKGGTVRFFDELVDLTGNVDFAAALSIHAASERLQDLVGTGGELAAPQHTSLADFRFKIGGSVGASATAGPSPLTVSAHGSLTSGVDYRHVLPVRQSIKRLTALTNLVKTTRPPQLVKIAELADGELHRLDATLHVDFGLDLQAGRSFAIERSFELFDGLPSADLTVNGQLAIQASLGLSLYERMFVAIGRAGRRVRLRLQRERQRRLGFSAMMALQAQYDFGGSLADVLEQALDQVQTPKLIDTLRKISDPLAAGDWTKIKASLTGEIADTLSELLDSTGWKDFLAGSDEVRDLLELSQKIVDFYDGIDPMIQGFWERLLGKADLGPGSKTRQILTRLTQVDQPGFDLEDLLDPDGEARELIDLIETLSGRSLEEILLSSSTEIEDLLKEVAGLARQAQKIFDLGDEVIAKLHDFAERTGIARTIEFLRQNASINSIQGLVSGRIRRLVERLVGKTWDKIEPADLAKVQAWAEKIQQLLAAPQEFEQALLAKIRDVRGEIGFSLTLEIERVSTSTALLDFEIDRAPKHGKLHRSLQHALSGGNVRDLLDVLAKEADKEKYETQALPFLLRECVFTSRRVRTSASTFVLSLLGPLGNFIGKQQGINRRIEEAAVRVTQTDQAFRREGSYSGGFSRTDVWNKSTNESALWLDVEDAGSGLDIDAAYDDPDALVRSLRITYSRDDFETGQVEVSVLADRLRQLGFGDADVSQVPSNAQTRFSIDFRLPEEALVELSGDLTQESAWNQDYLTSAHRWFQERLAGKPAADSPTSSFSHGEVIDAFITHNPIFGEQWTKSVQQFAAAARGKTFTVMLPGNHKVVISPPMVRLGPLPSPPFRGSYDPVRALISKRGKGLSKMKRFAGSLSAAFQGRTPEGYEEVTRDFADATKWASVYSTQWPIPTFGSWLVLVRLARLAPAVLREARGVAVLRFKGGGAAGDGWSAPIVWRLEEGQGLTL